MLKHYTIYKIINLDDEAIYYGKTFRTMKARINDHKSKSSKCACKYFNWNNVKVEELDILYCDDEQAKIIEDEYIVNHPCINKQRGHRTEEEIKEYIRKWGENNREKRNLQRKERYKEDPSKMKESQKRYREKHPDRVDKHQQNWKEKNPNYQTEWYDKNKEEVKKHRHEKIECECGRIVSRNGISHHYKSKIHQDYLNNL